MGRTGTFICIHSQLERLKVEGVVDFFQAAKSARLQRAGLISNDVCEPSSLFNAQLFIKCNSKRKIIKIHISLSSLQDHYAFCQEVVASYVDSFETYANFKQVV